MGVGMQADGGDIELVSVTGNEGLVVSGGEDGAVRLWELDSRRLVWRVRGHTGWVFATALSADGEMVASAGEDAVIPAS